MLGKIIIKLTNMDKMIVGKIRRAEYGENECSAEYYE